MALFMQHVQVLFKQPGVLLEANAGEHLLPHPWASGKLRWHLEFVLWHRLLLEMCLNCYLESAVSLFLQPERDMAQVWWLTMAVHYGHCLPWILCGKASFLLPWHQVQASQVLCNFCTMPGVLGCRKESCFFKVLPSFQTLHVLLHQQDEDWNGLYVSIWVFKPYRRNK